MTERVRITSPHTAGRRPRPLSGTEEIDAHSPVGEIYMRSLIRSQLRIAIAMLVAIGLGIGGIPLLFWFVPDAADVSVFGIPLAWLLLGGVAYPVLVVVGWLYVRQAERNERQFSELIGPKHQTRVRGQGSGRPRTARQAHPDEAERR